LSYELSLKSSCFDALLTSNRLKKTHLPSDFYLDSFQIAYFCETSKFPGMTADQLPLSTSARIEDLSESPYRVTLMELGFLPGKIITLQHRAPAQGPMAFKLDETVLALRKQEAAVLQVTLLTARS
jgi:ferrous iron transport protein A